ncbi:hypothetical protein QSJ18_10870 [Gordonia sp. ABSL1-1]|uniref:hypothetical protein n=1 Tax=Gordonia sp. ABSL1-1 TaxID=3053923 RepID=UPI0025748F77|nr:hypothetical protein [Gordonia sp. ABSL1-1]MDL9937246.1 hypothetical protein [Gordonia sp. ABSL1-1]
MNRKPLRILRSVLAGIVLAATIGLGAFNSWWVALIVGPLGIIGAFTMLAPRPTRVSELPAHRRGSSSAAVPIRVEALTRSSLGTGEVQPTMVTATIDPPDDTEYQARWITAMTRGSFTSLVGQPHSTLAPTDLPPRPDGRRAPEFDDEPGRWAVIYPAIMVVTLCAVLFAVGGGWHVSAPRSISSLADAIDSGTDDSDTAGSDLTKSLNTLLGAVDEHLGPQARDNLLSVQLSGESGSDIATVFDPRTGRATNVYVSGRSYTSPVPNTLRKSSVFSAGDLASTDMGAIVARMKADATPFTGDLTFERLTAKRTDPGQPVLLTGTFDPPNDRRMSSVDIEATLDGSVAGYFDPGDLKRSMDLARSALTSAQLSLSAPAIRELRIRGTADGTPFPLEASNVQNSGGIVIDHVTPRQSATITIVPGKFPEVRTTSGSTGEGVAFDDISLATLESVRNQAMTRGAVSDFDRNGVEIAVESEYYRDPPTVITVGVGPDDASEGTYSLTGEFLKAGTY